MADKMKGPELAGMRERRIFRGITQTEMAETISVNQSHYRQIETGGVRLDIHRALKLARKLECSIEDLL